MFSNANDDDFVDALLARKITKRELRRLRKSQSQHMQFHKGIDGFVKLVQHLRLLYRETKGF